jgi:predicted transcriptional regulator
MSNRLGVPFEGAEGESLGIELYELASFGAAFHRGIDGRLMALQILLAGDLECVVGVVRSAAGGAEDLVGTIVISDDIRRLLALPANHSEI